VKNKFKKKTSASQMPGWREYQDKLKKTSRKRSIFRYGVKLITLACLLFLGAYLIIAGWRGRDSEHADVQPVAESDNKESSITPGYLLLKEDIQNLITAADIVNLQDESIKIVADGSELRVATSIDIALQQFILKKMKKSTSRYIGIVVMNPSSGRVLAMAGYDKTDPSGNPCLENKFPAASIFKIVTAAAAIEKCGFSPQSDFKYNGRKHTLYKKQLKELNNKYTNHVTLKDSFAESVNPVFGKLGAIYLGKHALEEYADAFGFNSRICFEVELPKSSMRISESHYNWAEIACGFNRETMISPIHGALIASTILNQGGLLEPTIVDRIVDARNRAVYSSHVTRVKQAIRPETSKAIRTLMMATVRYGTCRKSFRGYTRDRVLSKLNIGGKTGTIDNKAHDARYDWFIGFAEEKDGPGKIAISVLVAHEKYIGTRASQYARLIMKEFFRDYFAKNKRRKPQSVNKS
jgi:cell division protein FtsI/penicillin-binding protein 2